MILPKTNFTRLNEKKSLNFLCENALSTSSSATDYSEPCICHNSFKKVDRNDQSKEKKSRVISTIKNINQPYKEISVAINNHQLALRIQKYPLANLDKYDPSCECIGEALDDPLQKSSSSKMNENIPSKPEKLLFEVVPPTDDLKLNDTLRLTNKDAYSPGDTESDEPENVYILKIRRRAETWDKKRENIDLEFRIP